MGGSGKACSQEPGHFGLSLIAHAVMEKACAWKFVQVMCLICALPSPAEVFDNWQRCATERNYCTHCYESTFVLASGAKGPAFESRRAHHTTSAFMKVRFPSRFLRNCSLWDFAQNRAHPSGAGPFHRHATRFHRDALEKRCTGEAASWAGRDIPL